MPAGSSSCPASKFAPFSRQLAPRLPGVTRISSRPGFRLSSPTSPTPPSNCTSSILMAVSKPSGNAVPVLAQSNSRPSCQVLVSGMPSSKSAKRTAMPSICAQSALGTSTFALQSTAVTRPNASWMSTTSTCGSNFAAPMSRAMASSRLSSTCFEWSRMTIAFQRLFILLRK